MDGSGGDTTAIRMLGSCIKTSRALLTFFPNWDRVCELEQEFLQRSTLPEDTITN